MDRLEKLTKLNQLYHALWLLRCRANRIEAAAHALTCTHKFTYTHLYILYMHVYKRVLIILVVLPL
jgi:hypothetical protein